MRFTTVYEVPRPNIHRETPSQKDGGRNLSKQHLPVDAPVGEEHLPADGPACDDHLPANLSGDLPEVLPTASSCTEPGKEAKTKEPTSEYLPTSVPGFAGDVPTEEDVAVGDTVRRSTRSRERPERLHYSRLGSPLVSIVQSLFQGLNTALTEVVLEAEQTNRNSSLNLLPDSSSHAQRRAYIQEGRV